jgi:glycosyltransferase involved in cell wall biosynthesis
MVNSPLAREYAMEVFPRSGGDLFPQWSPIRRRLFTLSRLVKLFAKVAAGHFDLVHIHSSGPNFRGTIVYMLLIRLTGTEVLLHLHGTDWDYFYEKESALEKFLLRIGLSLPSKIVVLYAQWAENIRRFGVKSEVRVVRNLIHRAPPPDPSQAEMVRREIGLEKDDFVVLMVGSVGERKGVFDLLAAVPEVISVDDSIRFVLAGGEEEPGEMTRILDLIENKKLGAWVKVLGEVIGRRSRFCWHWLISFFFRPSPKGCRLPSWRRCAAGYP